MNAFTQSITGWHDFYILIGTASATLVGLLFISLSLNADVISRKSNIDLRALAEQTFATFLFVILFAAFFLIPDQSALGLGLPVLAVGLLGLRSTISHYFKTRQIPHRSWGRSSIANRFILPLVCFLVLIIIAVTVLLGNMHDLSWLVPIMIILIITASFNAWDLLLRLRESHEKARSG